MIGPSGIPIPSPITSSETALPRSAGPKRAARTANATRTARLVSGDSRGATATNRHVRVAGTPEVSLTFTPTAPDQSVYVYLYAIDGRGTGSLLSHTPHTLRGATPGEPVTVDTELAPVVWDVPAGHRLAVVVDSMDARYQDESDVGDRVSVTSPEEAPARVTVPLA